MSRGMRDSKPTLVSAILLAAGEAKRMGTPKQLLPFGGVTILERTLDNLLGSSVDEVIVVLGANAQEIKSIIGDRPVKIVFNPDYRLGMSGSLICGLNQVSGKARKVMVALTDQPLIGKETYDRLVEESARSEKGIIIPVYRKKKGNPVIFSIGYKKELLALKGDIGAREVVTAHPGDILEVDVDSEGVIININTMDEYNSHSGPDSQLER
jgi:molybdenum cofactor cytidylyltransferase